MAKLEIVVAVLLVFTGSLVECQTTACDDIDTQACQLMIQTKPDLCTDETLSKTACPKFCKLCPLECYHCDDAVADYHNCNTTKLCAQGQVCMRKELKSWVDGHHEYQLSCEDSTHCDGSALSFVFGKRNIDSRDLTVSCCDTDRCNYPQDPLNITPSTAATTTAKPGCKKDIIVLVDDSRETISKGASVNEFLLALVSQIDIGQTGSHLSLVTYSHTVLPRWGLSTHMDKTSLMTAINKTNYHRNGLDRDIFTSLISFLLQQKSAPDNRQDAEDVIVMISSHHFHSDSRDQLLSNQLHIKYSDIIVIADRHEIRDMQYIATDLGHEISVDDVQTLVPIVPTIAKLICE